MAAACAAAPSALYAQGRAALGGSESTVVFRVGGAYSSNVLRQPIDESATYTTVGVVLGLDHLSRRVAATLVGDVEHRSYSAQSVDNEVYGNLDASLALQVVGDRLAWDFSNSYGQIRQDPLQINSPMNREYMNVFSTGPRLNLPLGGRNAIEFSAVASEWSYEDSSLFNGSARTVQAMYRRALSSRSSFTVASLERTTDYDRLTIRESTVRNVYIGYESRLASGSAAVAAGVSKVELRDRSDSTPYAYLSWSRDVGVRSRLVLEGGTEYVDPGTDFVGSAPGSIGSDRLNDVLPTAEVYRRSDASILHTTQYLRTTFRIGASIRQRRYEVNEGLASDEQRVELDLSRRLSPRTEVGVGVYVATSEFRASGQVDDDKAARLYWNKQFASRFTFVVAYQRDERNTDLGVAYQEDSVRVLFAMDARPRRAR